MEIYPSLISSDLLDLRATITQLDNFCDGYHLDVMDDHFVPNLTWGPAFINAITQSTHLPLQVHLMVDNPAAWIDRLKLCINDCFVFHVEAVSLDQAGEIINRLKKKKIKVGIALNPKTPFSVVESFLSLVDQVLVMTVEPGFSGQTFIPSVLEKIDTLVSMRKDRDYFFKIGVDGGVNEENITLLKHHQVDMVGVASAIFFNTNPVEALEALYRRI